MGLILVSRKILIGSIDCSILSGPVELINNTIILKFTIPLNKLDRVNFYDESKLSNFRLETKWDYDVYEAYLYADLKEDGRDS